MDRTAEEKLSACPLRLSSAHTKQMSNWDPVPAKCTQYELATWSRVFEPGAGGRGAEEGTGTWRFAITLGLVVQRVLQKPLGLSSPADGTTRTLFQPKGKRL